MEDDDLFAALEKEMAVPTCDSPDHDTSHLHKGPAEWFVWSQCPMCGFEAQKYALCHTFFSVYPVLLEMSGPAVVECYQCKSHFYHTYADVRSERRHT